MINKNFTSINIQLIELQNFKRVVYNLIHLYNLLIFLYYQLTNFKNLIFNDETHTFS